MPDLWMDVDTALSEVPINILPLIDDTDFKTREESVVYNQAGLDLVWNFVSTGGAMTQTAVTPTNTGGDYDWVNQGNGMYSIEIPASAGASINNDTEGFGWFTGVATGVLPWRGPTIGFRAAGLNNKLIDDAYSTTRGLAGTALPDAAADAAGGLPISDAGGLDMDAILADTADIQPKLGTPSDLGSGANLAANLVDIEAQTDDIGVAGAGLTAINLPDQTMNITGNITGNLSGSVGSVTGNVGGIAGTIQSLDALLAKVLKYFQLITRKDAAIATDNATELGEINANGGSGAGAFDNTTDAEEAIADSSSTPPTAAAIADAVWDEALAGHLSAGSTGEALNAAGAAGDPWTTSLPGAYGAGSAGYIVGNNLNAAVADVEADTQDIQSRIPAALTAGGSIKAALQNEAHGGVAAVLTLERIVVASTTTDEPAVKLNGNGSGAGLYSKGGNTGGGGNFVGGDVSGYGLRGAATTDGQGMIAVGANNKAGFEIGANGSGAGMYVWSGSGDGIRAVAGGVAYDINADIQGNLSGNVGGNVVGSVGSVTGNLNTAAGTIQTLDALDTAQDSQHSTTQAAIAALNDISAAEVNAEVVDALNVDTYAEPTGAPPATASLVRKIGQIYMALRNKMTTTASAKTFFDDGGASEWSKALTDDGTTYTEDEGV